ncbi:hypothetical protein IWC96_00260 [Brevundimonas sp. BAL450]|uniref:hypothetical protein n=2 Tax=Caulobacteraceae TaxID=76892 RepID=UPI0005EC2424|nr:MULTISPECIES: hypothetical protein [Brevundimonas]MBG7613713.1 hypothetical protein [Brevundimonas sp. BAL450]
MLVWISQRRFESEVIIGLNIIEAFDLATHFTFAEVRNSVNAASHLSDWLMKENFAQADGLFPFRYAYAPETRADLPESVRHSFSAFNGVPQMFHSHLSHLEKISGLPFLMRWQHEWDWLQADELRSQGDPSYFFHGNREITGQFDFADRETYVSAYLRTLAFAAVEWGVPHEIAERHSRAALTLNRGLASVEPIERPKWSDGILPGDRDIRNIASAIWAAASSDTNSNHMVAALRAVEVAETDYAVFEFEVVVGSATAFASHNEPADEQWSYLANPARYEGGFYSLQDVHDGSMPRLFCGTAIAFEVGRGLVELVAHVHLPTPDIDHPNLTIACRHNGVEMQDGALPIAHWEYWYCDWEPTYPRKVDGLIGYRTTVKRDFVEGVRERNSLKSAVWCSVKSGTRQYSYSDFQEQKAGFWIDT